jgi:colicin import membrane protein
VESNQEQFQMVCFAGIMAGNNRQSVDSKILAGMNDIGKVYLSAYRSGSEYWPRSKNNTEKVMLQQRRKQMHPENKVPPTKQSRLTIINPECSP